MVLKAQLSAHGVLAVLSSSHQLQVDASYGGLQDLAHFVQQAHMQRPWKVCQCGPSYREGLSVLSRLDLAVILDFVFNHMMWGQTLRTEKEVFNWLWESRQGAQFLYGPHLFLQEAKPNKACLLKANHTMIYGQETIWGPRPDFSKPEARRTKGCKMF